MMQSFASPQQIIFPSPSFSADFREVYPHLEVHTMEWFAENAEAQSRGMYEMLWIRSGSGEIIINGHTIMIENNRLFCLTPSQARIIFATTPVDGFYIRISPELLHLVESGCSSSFLSVHHSGRYIPRVIILDEKLQAAEDILTIIRRSLQHYVSNEKEILTGFFKLFMLYVSRKLGENELILSTDKNTDLVHQFLNLLKRNFIAMKMVSQYAEELCVPAPYLNRIVKKVSGFTASHHIQQHIILEAKRMAENPRTSMKEIAYTLGFKDIAHFSKFFKNYNGMNFTSFKRNPSIVGISC